jgi:hypothetical protein
MAWPSPTTMLVTLAIAGRNPADLSWPTVGRDAVGPLGGSGGPIRRVAVASRITPMGRPVTEVEPFREDGEPRSGCRCVVRR